MFTAFFDACVLVPVALSDTLLRTAEHGLFRPSWSPTVLAEVQRVMLRVHPDLARSRVDYRLRERDRAFPDASVSAEPLSPVVLGLPDPDDEHVLAAALGAHADVIVTANLKDFPEKCLRPLGLAALSAEDFLLDQLDLSSATMLDVLTEQAAATRRPPLDVEDVLIALGRAGVPGFSSAARRLLTEDGL